MTLNYADMMENNLAFSIWQLLTNEDNQKPLNAMDFKQPICIHYAAHMETVNLLNYELKQHSTDKRRKLDGKICHSILQNGLHLYGTKMYNITIGHY